MGIVKGISILADIFYTNDSETEYENQMKQQKALHTAQITKDIENRLLTSLLAEVGKIVDRSFQNSIDEVEQHIVSLKSNLDRKLNMKSILNESRIKINSINY